MVDDGGAVQKGFTIVEHQGRNPPQRVRGADVGTIAESRKVTLLEGQAVGLECNGDAPRVGRAVHSDKQHWSSKCAEIMAAQEEAFALS